MSEPQAPSARSLKRRATGPRTAAGKTRSRRNAYRHGLAVPVCLDPLVSAKVEKVARQIAGAGASETVMQIARRAAEAQLEVIRCRQARCRGVERSASQTDDLLTDILDDQTLCQYWLKARWDQKDKGPSENLDIFSDKQLIVIDRHRQRIRKRRERTQMKDLTGIDRYERRALSRRNRALQDLDCQRVLEATKDKQSITMRVLIEPVPAD